LLGAALRAGLRAGAALRDAVLPVLARDELLRAGRDAIFLAALRPPRALLDAAFLDRADFFAMSHRVSAIDEAISEDAPLCHKAHDADHRLHAYVRPVTALRASSNVRAIASA
jgi:hypothetical protein